MSIYENLKHSIIRRHIKDNFLLKLFTYFVPLDKAVSSEIVEQIIEFFLITSNSKIKLKRDEKERKVQLKIAPIGCLLIHKQIKRLGSFECDLNVRRCEITHSRKSC